MSEAADQRAEICSLWQQISPSQVTLRALIWDRRVLEVLALLVYSASGQILAFEYLTFIKTKQKSNHALQHLYKYLKLEVQRKF